MTTRSVKTVAPILAAIIMLRPGVGKCEEQPPPLCTDYLRVDAGKAAPCSGIAVPRETFADCLACAEERANPCVAEKADLKNTQVLLKAERDAHAETKATLTACETAGLPPKPEPVPEWYERPGLWIGLGLVASAIGGSFATQEHPGWYIAAGFGAGVALVEAVR